MSSKHPIEKQHQLERSQALATETSLSTFFTQFKKLALGAQFYWFLSLLSSIWFTILCVLYSTFKGASHPTSIYYYQYSMNSIILTYIIIFRQTYKSKPITFLFTQVFTLLKDSNVQYLIFAIIHRLFSGKIYGAVNSSTLYPFSVYALFHSINYFQSYILPYLPYLKSGTKSYYNDFISGFYKNYYEKSRFVAANTEILLVTFYILPLLKMIILLRILRHSYLLNNFKVLILFFTTIIFNKLRYDQDKYTQTQIMNYDMQFNKVMYNPMVPPVLKSAFASFRILVVRFFNLISINKISDVQRKRN